MARQCQQIEDKGQRSPWGQAPILSLRWDPHLHTHLPSQPHPQEATGVRLRSHSSPLPQPFQIHLKSPYPRSGQKQKTKSASQMTLHCAGICEHTHERPCFPPSAPSPPLPPEHLTALSARCPQQDAPSRPPSPHFSAAVPSSCVSSSLPVEGRPAELRKVRAGAAGR